MRGKPVAHRRVNVPLSPALTSQPRAEWRLLMSKAARFRSVRSVVTLGSLLSAANAASAHYDPLSATLASETQGAALQFFRDFWKADPSQDSTTEDTASPAEAGK